MGSEWRAVCPADRVPSAHDVRVLVDGHPVLLRWLGDEAFRVLSTDGSDIEHRVVAGVLELRLAAEAA